MSQTFRHPYAYPLSRYELRLDDQGIHDFRHGQPHASILWHDLEAFDALKLRATHGPTIKIFLPGKERARFAATLYVEWHRRYPERFLTDRARRRREQAWFVFLWLPLIYSALCGLLYLMIPSAIRHGAPASALYAKANRLALVSAGTLFSVWTLHLWTRWKERPLC